MMQFSSQLINTGTETHINLKPTVSYTTDKAISTLYPQDRGCYANGEANLTYLPYYHGFRYNQNNCLVDNLIGDIIWNCRCIPSFMPAISERDQYENMGLERCWGEKLNCAFKKMESVNTEKNVVKNPSMQVKVKILTNYY